LQQLQKGNDDDLDVMATMVNVYQRAKKFDQAQGVLTKAIQRFPNEEQVYFLQGSLYEKQKKYDDAEKAFRKALDLQKDDQTDPTNGAYLDSLGWVYYKQNRFDRAEEFLKKAAIFVNYDSSIHDHLGDLYFKTKRYDEARAEWTKSLQLSNEPEEIDKVKKKLDELKTVKAAKK